MDHLIGHQEAHNTTHFFWPAKSTNYVVEYSVIENWKRRGYLPRGKFSKAFSAISSLSVRAYREKSLCF